MGTRTVVERDSSVLRIEDGFGSCTGTRISRNGHILTARHCLNACLISGNYVESVRIYPEFGYQSPTLYLFPRSEEATYCEFFGRWRKEESKSYSRVQGLHDSK